MGIFEPLTPNEVWNKIIKIIEKNKICYPNVLKIFTGLLVVVAIENIDEDEDEIKKKLHLSIDKMFDYAIKQKNKAENVD